MKQLLLAYLLITLSINLQADPVSLTFVFQDSANYPFQTGSGAYTETEKPGIAVELMMLMAKELNLNIKFVRLPWKRALFSLKSGTVDGLFSASYKEKRLEYGVYPTTNARLDESKYNYTNTYSLYKLKSALISWDGITIDNLDFAVGAPLGFSIVDDLKKKIFPLKSLAIPQ